MLACSYEMRGYRLLFTVLDLPYLTVVFYMRATGRGRLSGAEERG